MGIVFSKKKNHVNTSINNFAFTHACSYTHNRTFQFNSHPTTSSFNPVSPAHNNMVKNKLNNQNYNVTSKQCVQSNICNSNNSKNNNNNPNFINKSKKFCSKQSNFRPLQPTSADKSLPDLSINNIKINENEHLCLLNWNLNSVNDSPWDSDKKNKNTLHNLIEEHNPHVICLQETKHKILSNNKIKYNISNYNYVHIPPKVGNKTTRGIILFFRKDLLIDTKFNGEKFNLPFVDNIGIRIKLKNNKFLQIHNVYRHSSDRALTLNHFFRPKCNDQIIVMGDFNIRHPAWSKGNSSTSRADTFFNNMIHLDDISLLNNFEPTISSGNTIDLVFMKNEMANHSNLYVDDSIRPDLKSKHFPLIIKINEMPEAPKKSNINNWNLKKADWDKFRYILNTNMHTLTHTEDINLAFDELENLITLAADNSVPKTEIHSGNSYSSWFNNKDCNAIRKKWNLAKKHYKNRKNKSNPDKLLSVTAEKEAIFKKAKSEKWLKYCKSFNSHTHIGDMWKYFNNTKKRGNYVKFDANAKQTAEINMKTISDNSKSSNWEASCKIRQEQLRDHRTARYNIASNLISNSDHLYTLDELDRVWKSKKDTAPGKDNIPFSFLKNSPKKFRLAFLNLINKSFSSSLIRDKAKIAKIITIPKSNGGFRPISLLSTLDKTVENLVLNRLNFLLPPLENHIYGFTRNKSCIDCLGNLNNFVAKKPSMAIFFDIDKAFDLVNKEVVLEALINNGISGKILKWINCHLSFRKGFVAFQGYNSKIHGLENGTPQGSILSPLLFNLVANEMLKRFKLKNKTFQYMELLQSYADDTCLCFSIPNHTVSDLSARQNFIQKRLDHLSEICKDLCLKLSWEKTKIMYFNIDENCFKNKFTLLSKNLENTSTYKYLGIILSKNGDNLCFQKHIDYIKERCLSRLNLMKAISGSDWGANRFVLRTFYLTAIHSVMTYGCELFFDLKKEILKPLILLQNCALRLILGVQWHTRISNMEIEAKIMPLQLYYKYKTLNFVNHCLSINNSYMSKFFPRSVDFHINNFYHYGNWHMKIHNLRRDVGHSHLSETFNYDIPEPWFNYKFKFVYQPLYTSKENCSTSYLNQFSKTIIKFFDNDYPFGIHFFTDGSLITLDDKSKRVGCAFHCPLFNSQTVNISKRLNNATSILQAEIYAIIIVFEYLIQNKQFIHDEEIIIFSDSASTIQFLQNYKCNDNVFLFNKFWNLLKQLSSLCNIVIITWIPSHTDIPGNDQADTLAKLACNKPQIDIYLYKSKTATKIDNYNKITKLWHYDHSMIQSFTTIWTKNSTQFETFPKDLSINREIEVKITKIRLNIREKTHVYEDKIQYCKYCDAEYNSQHYLADCPAGYNARKCCNLFGLLKIYQFNLNTNDKAAAMLYNDSKNNFKKISQYIDLFPAQR